MLSCVHPPRALVQCGDPPSEVTFSSYFTLKAERDIAAGEQVLHTYGELSGEEHASLFVCFLLVG